VEEIGSVLLGKNIVNGITDLLDDWRSFEESDGELRTDMKFVLSDKRPPRAA
jgi:hypothetical protein